MNCDCKDRIDKELEKQNLFLVGFSSSLPDCVLVPLVRTDWLDRDKAPKGKKNSPPQIFANHCPFCGVAVEKEKKAEAVSP